MNLKGLGILITSGPTRESWDTVRYLTNRSTGITGFAIADKAREKGASVTLVSSIAPPSKEGLNFVPVESALEMFEAVKKHFIKSDIFISAAAVADFRPVSYKSKIEKSGAVPVIKLHRNPDILEWAGLNRGGRVIAGFSLSDSIDTSKAREKMIRKNCGIMIANPISNMGSHRKTFMIIDEQGERLYRDLIPEEAADIILEKCANQLKNF